MCDPGLHQRLSIWSKQMGSARDVSISRGTLSVQGRTDVPSIQNYNIDSARYVQKWDSHRQSSHGDDQTTNWTDLRQRPPLSLLQDSSGCHGSFDRRVPRERNEPRGCLEVHDLGWHRRGLRSFSHGSCKRRVSGRLKLRLWRGYWSFRSSNWVHL